MARITGKLGSVWIDGSKRADTYNWALELNVDVARASVKGDAWERRVPGRGSGTLTIDAYIQTNAFFTRFLPATIGPGTRVGFILYAIDPSASFEKVSGSGYVSRGSIGMPHDDKATDSVEITLDGAPTFV